MCQVTVKLMASVFTPATIRTTYEARWRANHPVAVGSNLEGAGDGCGRSAKRGKRESNCSVMLIHQLTRSKANPSGVVAEREQGPNIAQLAHTVHTGDSARVTDTGGPSTMTVQAR